MDVVVGGAEQWWQDDGGNEVKRKGQGANVDV